MSIATTSDVRGWSGQVVVTVTFETILGLLAAFFIGFFAPVVLAIGTLASLARNRIEWTVLLGVMTLITGALAVLIARLAAHASVGRWDIATDPDPTAPVVKLPFALAMAAQLPVWPWLGRFPVGAWWLSHFLGAALLGHFIAASLIQRLDVATALIAVPLAIVVHFSFLFAANLYLVLAARVLLPHPRVCISVWRFRFLIDFLLALTLVLADIGK